MGRNGAGKSTLLSALVGLRRPDAGTVRVGRSADAADPHALAPRDLVRRVGLVPQEPGDLLYADTRRPRSAGPPTATPALPPGRRSRSSPSWCPASTRRRTRATCPRASGSRSRWPWSSPAARRWCCSTSRPAASTTPPRRGWCAVLRGLAAAGHAVVLATHDVELAATLADRIVVLAEGEVVADGPAREVVVASPAFAPQVAKVLAPQPWLTVAEVAHALRAG